MWLLANLYFYNNTKETTMTNTQPQPAAPMHMHTITAEKHNEWCKRKDSLYNEIIALAGIDEIKLSDDKEDNLEYAMEIILNHGTYYENAKAIKMYAQYFNLDELLDI
jgi:hypothetical protein